MPFSIVKFYRAIMPFYGTKMESSSCGYGHTHSPNHPFHSLTHKTNSLPQDTGSSNGTFINSQRLSSNSTSSEPYEIRTDDIVQFGVDVMENNKKETHGCIVCLVKLFVPEGEECKTARGDGIKIESSRMIPSTDLCRLNQYLQEAMQREQVLETKLFSLQKIVETTRYCIEQRDHIRREFNSFVLSEKILNQRGTQ